MVRVQPANALARRRVGCARAHPPPPRLAPSPRSYALHLSVCAQSRHAGDVLPHMKKPASRSSSRPAGAFDPAMPEVLAQLSPGSISETPDTGHAIDGDDHPTPTDGEIVRRRRARAPARTCTACSARPSTRASSCSRPSRSPSFWRRPRHRRHRPTGGRDVVRRRPGRRVRARGCTA